jgi:hypothetical protein
VGVSLGATPRYASSVQLFLSALSAALKLTPARQPNFAPGAVALVEPSQEDQKGTLSVDDWAEIRRLHRAQVPAKVIARPTALIREFFQ